MNLPRLGCRHCWAIFFSPLGLCPICKGPGEDPKGWRGSAPGRKRS